MKTIVNISAMVTTMVVLTSPVQAGGLERLPQSLGILFEKGNYAEFSFGAVRPTVSGRDRPAPDGAVTGDVAKNFDFMGLGYKHQFSDKLSAALIVEQPFGSDVAYPANGSAMFGGSKSEVNSTTYTALLNYKIDGGIGLHGGLRASRIDAAIDLRGAAFGRVNGYSLRFDDTWGTGYAVGVSYERPATATRVVLTYQSPITHDFGTTESGPLAQLNGTGESEVRTPRSWNLDAQRVIAPGTLLMGSIRWVKWSEFKVEPRNFTDVTGGGMVELKDTTTFSVGVAKKLTDQWSGVVSVMYEPQRDIVDSPLSPTNGRKGITLAGIYNSGPLKIVTAIGFVRPGDTSPATGNPKAERADFTDSDVLAFAMKVGYSF